MTLLIFMAVATLMAAIFFILMNRDLTRIENELASKAHVYSEFLTQDLIKVLFMGSVDLAADITSRLRTIPEIEGIVVYKNNNKPVFQYIATKTAAQAQTKEMLHKQSADDILTLSYPLEYQGKIYGAINIKMSRALMKKTQKEYVLHGTFIGLLLILLSFLLAMLIERYFTQPVLELLSALQHIAKTHDYSFRLAIKRFDEMGDLFHGFNHLQKELQITHLELLNQKYALDQAAIVSIADHKGQITYVNDYLCSISCYSRNELIGQPYAFMNTSEDAYNLSAEIETTIKKGEIWRGELKNLNKHGDYWCIYTTIVPFFDNQNKITQYLSVSFDISERKKAEKKLNYQATHDELTGLINRHEFEYRVKSLLSTQNSDNQMHHAMCFMDLDQFKIINDSCGHIAGDELLRQLSKLLQETVRQTDTLARLGGDEFGLLMTHCSIEQAHRIATIILEKVQDFNFFWDNQSFRIGISIGLVPILHTIQAFDELLKQADSACYMAKDLGRNRVHVYSMDDSEMAQRHGEMQWTMRINNALDEHRFCLYAQPIISLGKDEKEHYELLIRMLDKQGDVIPPGAFLPAAERYNLIEKLDLWVIDNALSLLADNPDFMDNIHFISINLSGPSLTNEAMLTFIIDKLTKLKINPEKICFEVTETVAISNLNKAINFISMLKKMGCHFALDDFGSGLSSFGYLKNLPVDYLKIDGMFVKDMINDAINYAMVKSINEIGQVMGMKTIAEFVEDEPTRQILKKMGVNYAQGFGLGKPQPFDKIIKQSQTDRDII